RISRIISPFATEAPSRTSPQRSRSSRQRRGYWSVNVTIHAREPVMFCFDRDFALALVENETGRFSVTVTLPDKKFLVDSLRSADEQSMAASLEPHGNFGYAGHTLSPP